MKFFIWVRLLWQDHRDPDENGGPARLILARSQIPAKAKFTEAKRSSYL